MADPYVPGNERLGLLAQALLNSAIATLRSERLPDRRYRSFAANPTMDCAQLVVYPVPQTAVARTPRGQAPTRTAGSVQSGAIPGKSSGPLLPLLAWRVQLVIACAPTMKEGNPPQSPSAADLDAFGYEGLIDGYDLFRGLIRAQINNSLFGDLVTDCSGAEVGPLTPGGYQGAFGWWSVDVSAADLDWRNV